MLAWLSQRSECDAWTDGAASLCGIPLPVLRSRSGWFGVKPDLVVTTGGRPVFVVEHKGYVGTKVGTRVCGKDARLQGLVGAAGRADEGDALRRCRP